MVGMVVIFLLVSVPISLKHFETLYNMKIRFPVSLQDHIRSMPSCFIRRTVAHTGAFPGEIFIIVDYSPVPVCEAFRVCTTRT
jgi:hypothetical protein